MAALRDLSQLHEAIQNDELVLVCDFDGSLTSEQSKSSMNAMAHYLGPENDYSKARDKLYQRFRPILESSDTTKKRKDILSQWWQEQMMLLLSSEIGESQLEAAAAKVPIELRPESKVLLSSRIPLYIVSAGLGNIISALLRQWGYLSKNITILSNYLVYNGGHPLSFTPVVHPLNKEEIWNREATEKHKESRLLLIGNRDEDNFIRQAPQGIDYIDVRTGGSDLADLAQELGTS